MTTNAGWPRAVRLMWISIVLTAAGIAAARGLDIVPTPVAAGAAVVLLLLIAIGGLVGRGSLFGFALYGVALGMTLVGAVAVASVVLGSDDIFPGDWEVALAVGFAALWLLHAATFLMLRSAEDDFRKLVRLAWKSELGWRREVLVGLGSLAVCAPVLFAAVVLPQAFEDQDRYGIVEAGGAVRQEAVYGMIYPLNLRTGHAAAGRDGKWGLLDAEGREVVPLRFESYVVRPGLDLAAGRVDGKWGVFDLKGNAVVEPRYEDLTIVDRDFAWVKSGGKWGAIDLAGKVRIAPEHASHGRALKDIVLVTGADKRWRLLDRDGKHVSEASFTNVRAGVTEEEAELLAATADGKKWGFIDHAGKFVVEARFDVAQAFGPGGVARVRVGDKWGYVDRLGALVVEAKWDEAKPPLPGGLLAVRAGALWGVLDRAGKVIVEPRYASISDARQGLIAVRAANGRWGLLDAAGTAVVEPRFASAPSFRAHGLSRVELGASRVGVVDLKGRMVVEPRYEDVIIRELAGSEVVIVLMHARMRASVRDVAGKELLAPRPGVDDVYAKSGGTLLLESIERRHCLFGRAICLP